MSLDDRFKKAVYLVRNGPPKPNSSNEEKLSFYKYYKQATEGDVTGSQPWAVQLEARAKWDAWKSVEGISQDEAKEKYIELVASGDANWESHEVLKSYTA
jgi:diazepam-binding inhibitor (GABA receptor modulating acyl-CoA-binding protein)